MSDIKSTKKLADEPTEFVSARDNDGEEIHVKIRFTNEVGWGAPEMMRMYNTQMRRNLHHLGYIVMGRYYYDAKSEVKIPEFKIRIWKGIMTAIKSRDGGILLSCDSINKFVRDQTVYEILKNIAGSNDFKEEARRILPGSIVMTQYNNKTYRIDDICFDKNPSNYTFERRSEQITLVQYYQQQYEITIKDPKQPLIECMPSVRDKRAGRLDKLVLIPEVCLMTGLTDQMRQDFTLGRKLAEFTRLNPARRVADLNTFSANMRSHEEIKKEMDSWGLHYDSRLVMVAGKQLPAEKLLMGGDVPPAEFNQRTSDFSQELRGKPLTKAAAISRWVVIFTPRDQNIITDFCQTLNNVCLPMAIKLGKPKTMELENDRTGSFIEAIKALHPACEMVVCIVPNNNKDRYDSIKKICCIERPVASQVIVSRTLNRKQMLMSICTKIGIQMTCKMGAEAWAIHIPPKNMMVVGYDTYHDSAQKGRSVGGFVCSYNQTLTRWYSRVAFHKSREEMSGNFYSNFSDGLRVYHKHNEQLPDKILIYRDGVGEGMINHVYDYELKQIKKALTQISPTNPPKLIFIIVTKKINTRFFAAPAPSRYENPCPGIIVDSVVTRPERYDFFLVSQSVRQGTVSPTMYNIIEDETTWKPHNHQQLTYKLTHLYYNWAGTIRVPAPCQYAHKLAFLTGTSLHREPSVSLSDRLFYL